MKTKLSHREREEVEEYTRINVRVTELFDDYGENPHLIEILAIETAEMLASIDNTVLSEELLDLFIQSVKKMYIVARERKLVNDIAVTNSPVVS